MDGGNRNRLYNTTAEYKGRKTVTPTNIGFVLQHNNQSHSNLSQSSPPHRHAPTATEPDIQLTENDSVPRSRVRTTTKKSSKRVKTSMKFQRANNRVRSVLKINDGISEKRRKNDQNLET